MQQFSLVTALARHNLPNLRTSFIGRTQAIDSVADLLRTAQVLTLVGSGGSGKTRLALQVAQRVLDEYNAVWWVDLAALRDERLLEQTVATALGLQERPGVSPFALLCEALQSSGTLLIFDNCEHLRAVTAGLITGLFAAGCPIQVLATSREPLAIAEEQIWLVPLLELPNLDERPALATLRRCEAIQLFVARAQMVAPGFALHEQNRDAVVQICADLEGLPLAIELAAARIALLSPQQIAQRLDQSMALLSRGFPASDGRHQMLRSALDWSFNLLAPAEQALFVRLAVFASSVALEAVEHICSGEGIERNAILDLLTTLVEKSLLVVYDHGEQMRYRLLEPVRQYALERLAATGMAAYWGEQHMSYFLALAEQAAAAHYGPHQASWFAQLAAEHDHLRKALAWCADAQQVERGLRFAAALQLFWQLHGYRAEGLHWIHRFFALAGTNTAPPWLVRGLHARARLLAAQSHFAEARDCYQQSLAMARQFDLVPEEEISLRGLGGMLWELGENAAAKHMLESALTLARAGNDQHALASTLINLALVYQYQTELAQASAYYAEALAIVQAAGDQAGTARVLFNLATLAEQRGEYQLARRQFHEAVALQRQLGDRSGAADTLLNLSALLCNSGDFTTARAVLQEAEQTYRELDNWGDLGYVYANRGDIAFYSEQYAEASMQFHEALSLFQAAGNQRLVARSLGMLARCAIQRGELADGARLCHEALAIRQALGHRAGMIFSLDGGYLELALATQQPALAARLLGAADAARTALDRPRTPLEAAAIETTRQRLQRALGEGLFLQIWQAGQALSLAAAAEEARQQLRPDTLLPAHPLLRVCALGPLRVYRGEELLISADWVYAKARELVLYLCCRPAATREQIGAALWPEASTAQVRQRLSAALAHARNALGREHDWICLHEGRYSLNQAHLYWFDVEQFERNLNEARQLLQGEHEREQAVMLLQTSVNLYEGDFAADLLDNDWPDVRREQLRRAYLEALVLLGQAQSAAGQSEQAIEAYQRALAHDAYQEEAHHGLIKLYIRLDKRRQAFAQYEQLCAALAELHLQPAGEMTELIERLRF